MFALCCLLWPFRLSSSHSIYCSFISCCNVLVGFIFSSTLSSFLPGLIEGTLYSNVGQLNDFRGFARFVNIRDGKGETPLHLAARQRQPECVHILLDSGALVCASTGGYG